MGGGEVREGKGRWRCTLARGLQRTSSRRTRMHGAAAQSLRKCQKRRRGSGWRSLGRSSQSTALCCSGTASAAIRGICERALLSGVRLLSRRRARLKVVLKASPAGWACEASVADGPRGKLLLAVTAALRRDGGAAGRARRGRPPPLRLREQVARLRADFRPRRHGDVRFSVCFCVSACDSG